MYLSASVEPPPWTSNELKLGLQLLVRLVVVALVDGEAFDVDIGDGCRQGLLVRRHDVDGVFHYGVGHVGDDEGVLGGGWRTKVGEHECCGERYDQAEMLVSVG
jgi:hypothetical protein